MKAKAKAPPKRPTEFKAGKWNPDTQLVEVEAEKYGDMEGPSNCSIKCSLRSLHRAVNN